MSQFLRLDSYIWQRTVALPLLLATVIWAGTARAHAAPDNLADLVDKLLPVVVHISTYQVVESTGGSEQKGLGSGFIIDSSGYIVTLHRIIENVAEINVRLHDGTSLVAEVIGSDEKTELAILKVANGKPLPAAEWGDSDKTRTGDGVIAIGNPYGLGGTVTAGIVSGLHRDINSGPYDDFIQTDATMNPGNSGGPLFNLDGEVVGINATIFSKSGGSIGIGFAIPSNLARDIIERLRVYGRVRRGWLGLRFQTVTEELAELLRLDGTYGALVHSVTEGGPADKAGIEGGDVILKIDGRDVTEFRKLFRMTAETEVGKAVDVVVWRKRKEVTLQVEFGELVE